MSRIDWSKVTSCVATEGGTVVNAGAVLAGDGAVGRADGTLGVSLGTMCWIFNVIDQYGKVIYVDPNPTNNPGVDCWPFLSWPDVVSPDAVTNHVEKLWQAFFPKVLAGKGALVCGEVVKHKKFSESEASVFSVANKVAYDGAKYIPLKICPILTKQVTTTSAFTCPPGYVKVGSGTTADPWRCVSAIAPSKVLPPKFFQPAAPRIAPSPVPFPRPLRPGGFAPRPLTPQQPLQPPPRYYTSVAGAPEQTIGVGEIPWDRVTSFVADEGGSIVGIREGDGTVGQYRAYAVAPGARVI